MADNEVIVANSGRIDLHPQNVSLCILPHCDINCKEEKKKLRKEINVLREEIQLLKGGKGAKTTNVHLIDTEVAGPSTKMRKTGGKPEAMMVDPHMGIIPGPMVLMPAKEFQWKDDGTPYGTLCGTTAWKGRLTSEFGTDYSTPGGEVLFKQFRNWFRSTSDKIRMNCPSKELAQNLCQSIRKMHLKMIHLDASGYGSNWTLNFKKLEISVDFQFNGVPKKCLEIGRYRKDIEDLVSVMNEEALLGYTGPGFFPCLKKGCQVCDAKGMGDRTSKSPTIRVGDVVHVMNKRFNCQNAYHCFYLLTCRACANPTEPGVLPTWAAYVGAAEILGRRLSTHACHTSKAYNKFFKEDVLKELVEILSDPSRPTYQEHLPTRGKILAMFNENGKLPSDFWKKKLTKKEGNKRMELERAILKALLDVIKKPGIPRRINDKNRRFQDSYTHFGQFYGHGYKDIEVTVLEVNDEVFWKSNEKAEDKSEEVKEKERQCKAARRNIERSYKALFKTETVYDQNLIGPYGLNQQGWE